MSNRFVLSATYEGMAATDGLIGKMAELAEGDVGLIISSHAFVSTEGRARPLQLGAYSDSLIPGLKKMTGIVHVKKSRIVLQLAHADTENFRPRCFML